ncbi:hypothetical protein QJQ45_010664 [Haematococcus lacustris]|nr:hypothetical protein QJQ45_010664 [Haematococcus lacustris]
MKWVSRQHYHQERGVAVFLGAGNFSQGGWKAGAVRAGFRKVVEQPSRPSTDPRPDRLVIVDEFRTSRVSSSVHARQPCELHLPDDRPRPADWEPPAIAPSLERAWLDRDTNPCLNFQRIGESMQRPLELCSWTDLRALPPVGKEYQQRYKLVNDRLPKVRQRLHRAAEYRRGIDGRARNNAVVALASGFAAAAAAVVLLVLTRLVTELVPMTLACLVDQGGRRRWAMAVGVVRVVAIAEAEQRSQVAGNDFARNN